MYVNFGFEKKRQNTTDPTCVIINCALQDVCYIVFVERKYVCGNNTLRI